MNHLPADQQVRFDKAVRHFRSGNGPVRVTPEKLRDFLTATHDLDLPPAARLRSLAIQLETEEFDQGWTGLRAIYEAAAEADPADALVLHSWGISATHWADKAKTPSTSGRAAIVSEAERVLHAALELAPGDSSVAHALGWLNYIHPATAEATEKQRSEALNWFERAVQWDPGNTLSQLYISHCFHDRKDWRRAISEYEKVDLDRLPRDWPAWRAVKCREQLAQCYAYAGDRAESLRRFTAFLDEADAWDKESAEERIINLDELVKAATDILMDPKLLRRARLLAERLGFQTWYPELSPAGRAPAVSP